MLGLLQIKSSEQDDFMSDILNDEALI